MAVQRDIRIVLVNPSHPGNIGAAARAIKNMGLSQLVLVAPQEFPDPRAIWRAAGAKDLVENARVVDTLSEAIADCQLVVGTSARERRIPWPLVEPRACADRIFSEPADAKIAVLFGREDSGLTNEELQRCNLHVNVPTSDAYRSLNLAMAVQIISYELRMRSLQHEDRPQAPMDEWDEPLATSDEVERMYVHLFETLAQLEFYDPKQPKQLLTRLRRMFNRTRLDQMELNILRGILTEVQKKIK
ncbi:MAG: tRNA (cytosine(32)/uridine(32)-2'-O)-methyltransferase TrmJ [Pseudomonadales bacterium]|nr:tRNA (cytosine(32)/uridine(32)-2'-O)-methyltransferase TrmJ [Gammaproteobacteria bacterium]NNL56588.1 tRNA (cytosine(32)/uridine(32)-2'-O)-methyltransferase TrmJ [Pseudomonadales bacterium]